MASIGWSDLTKEEQQRARDLGLVTMKSFGAMSEVSRSGDFSSVRSLLGDTEFLAQAGDLAGRDLGSAFTEWTGSAPIRQQERVARASVDLGLENTPEVIAGGTASTQRSPTRRRVGGNTSADLASTLGLALNPANVNISSTLGVL